MHKNQQGQTLFIIILLMILALSVGMSVSGRYIKTLSQVVQSDQGSRALAVAEGAVEHVLQLPIDTLQEYANMGTCGSECTLSINSAEGTVLTANVELTTLGGSSEPYIIELFQDDVTQVSLNGYPAGSSVNICWNNDMSVSGLYLHGIKGSYDADAFAYNSVSSLNTQNNFDSAVGAFGYNSCFAITTLPDSFMLRLKSHYESGFVAVLPAEGQVLPEQGVLIESVGVAGDATRKVTVIVNDSSVPLDFDYALYQESESLPLSN